MIHNRSSRILLALPVVALVLGTGCDRLKKKDDSSGSTSSGDKSGGEGSGGDKSDDRSKSGSATSGCKLPDTVDKDFTVTKGCSVKVEDNVTIEEGATLTIQEGAKLSFTGGGINVNYGRIVAKGTEKEPIVMTSANKSPAPGDWAGIVFNEKTSAGAVLDHVIVEYAGKKNGETNAAISVNGSSADGRIAITSCTIRKNEQGGIWNQTAKAAFAKLEGNTFEGNKEFAVDLAPPYFGGVGQNKWGGEAIRLDGDEPIDKTTTWPKVDVPVFVDATVHVKGDKAPVTLTIADGTTLKFKSGAGIVFEGDSGGGIVAKNVVFTSASGNPDAGDWTCLYWSEKATTSTLEGATFEYGGAGNGECSGVVTLASKKAYDKISIKTSTFKKNASDQAIHLADGGDCGAFTGGGNKSEGTTLCKAD